MNAAAQPLPKSKRRTRPFAAILFCVIALAGYLWWRPIQAERTLEEASLEQLQQITTDNPKYARAFYYLGLSLGRKGQKAESYAALMRAAELAPDEEEIVIAKAGAVNAQAGPEASFGVMNDFLKRHPESVKMKEQRTSLLSSLQRASDGFAAASRYKESIKYYQIWLKEEPTATNAQEGLQKALKASGNKGSEVKNAFLTLAEVYEKQGDRTKADEARKQAEQVMQENESKAKH